MKNRTDYDIIVCGAGVIGLAQAALLRADGWRVAVVEAAPPRRFDPEEGYDLRALAITPASRRVLELAGAWPAIEAVRIGPCERMEVWDAAGCGRIGFDAADLALPALGWIIEEGLIADALEAALDGVSFLRPVALQDFAVTDEEVLLQLADGRRVSARLLVGADGARSRVRRLAGIGERERDYRQHALVATVRCERAHERTARQCFLPTGPLAFLPLDEPRTCAVVWSTTPEAAARLERLAPAEFAAELSMAFEQRLGAVEPVGRCGRFPLVRGHATEYVRPRLALVGDAAHHIHPLAGQGANLGLMDVVTLTHCLREARERGREDPGRLPALRRHARWRRGENLQMIAAMDLFRELFGSANPLLAAARGAGMRLVDRLPPLKEELMLRAMGLAGDLPPEVRAAAA